MTLFKEEFNKKFDKQTLIIDEQTIIIEGLKETVREHSSEITKLKQELEFHYDICSSTNSRRSIYYITYDLFKIPLELIASRGLFSQLYMHMLNIINRSIAEDDLTMDKYKDVTVNLWKRLLIIEKGWRGSKIAINNINNKTPIGNNANNNEKLDEGYDKDNLDKTVERKIFNEGEVREKIETKNIEKWIMLMKLIVSRKDQKEEKESEGGESGKSNPKEIEFEEKESEKIQFKKSNSKLKDLFKIGKIFNSDKKNAYGSFNEGAHHITFIDIDLTVISDPTERAIMEEVKYVYQKEKNKTKII